MTTTPRQFTKKQIEERSKTKRSIPPLTIQAEPLGGTQVHKKEVIAKLDPKTGTPKTRRDQRAAAKMAKISAIAESELEQKRSKGQRSRARKRKREWHRKNV
jgi:hypothetical protein